MQLVQITKEQYLALMEAGCPAHTGPRYNALAAYKGGKMDQYYEAGRDLWEAWAREYNEYWTCVE